MFHLHPEIVSIHGKIRSLEKTGYLLIMFSMKQNIIDTYINIELCKKKLIVKSMYEKPK